jgi:hypothetical protein
MTLDEFRSKKWQHSEPIDFIYNDKIIECILLAIDFEQELFKIVAIDKDVWHDIPFWVRVEYCRRPFAKLKVKK